MDVALCDERLITLVRWCMMLTLDHVSFYLTNMLPPLPFSLSTQMQDPNARIRVLLPVPVSTLPSPQRRVISCNFWYNAALDENGNVYAPICRMLYD